MSLTHLSILLCTGPGDTTSLLGAGCSCLLLSFKSKSHFHAGSPSSMKLLPNRIRECQGLVGLREHLGRRPHFMKSEVFSELPQVTRSLESICSTSPFLLWSPDHPRLQWVFNIHPGPSPWLPFSKTSATTHASVLGCCALEDSLSNQSFFKRGCVSELKESFHGKLYILYPG